jgi:hypothetical protein
LWQGKIASPDFVSAPYTPFCCFGHHPFIPFPVSLEWTQHRTDNQLFQSFLTSGQVSHTMKPQRFFSHNLTKG